MAAGTITTLIATPYRVVFSYAGANGTDSLTAVQVLAAMAAGPLKTFMSNVNSGIQSGISGWVSANMRKFVTISVQPSNASASFDGVGFNGVSPTTQLVFTSTGVCTVVVEIKYNHSAER